MYNFLLKKGQLVAIGLGILLVAVFLISIFGGLDNFLLIPEDERPTSNTSIFNFGLGVSIFLAALCALVALLFGIYQAISNPKGAMFGLIGLGVILGLWLIFYNMAPAETGGKIAEIMVKDDISQGSVNFVEGGIKTSIVIAAIALIAFVGSEIRNLFK